jgi:hypothetical protein
MHSRSQKYQGEQDPRHGSLLQWPGAQGLPFRGDAVPNVKQEELEQLPVVGEAFQQTFDLTDEEQATSYRWVRDRIRNGMFTQDYVYREHTLDADKNKLRTLVYLEWTQLYVQAPLNSNSGVTVNDIASHKFTFKSE